MEINHLHSSSDVQTSRVGHSSIVLMRLYNSYTHFLTEVFYYLIILLSTVTLTTQMVINL
jgi:hypothetical protein